MIKENTKPNIKPGYKKTPVGMIPEDWEVKKLRDICELKSGGTPSRKEDKYWNGTIPWITTSLVDFNNIKETEEFITAEGLENSSANVFPKGTTIMAIYGQGVTRGKVARLGIDASTNQACVAFLNDNMNLQAYLFYSLSYRYLKLRNLSNDGSQKNLSSSILREYKLPIPPLPEQKAIADCLSTWDKGIEKLSALIASKKEQKKGLMQGLFSGELKVENGELIQAKEGEDFTKGWKKIELKEILTYEQPTKYLSNNFNDLLNENKVPVLTANKSFVLGYTDENVGIYNKLPVIIFDDFTTASRLVDFSFKVKSSAIKFLQTKSNFNIYFIFERLQLIKIDTTTHKRRWISEFENMVLSIPTIMEQNAFAQFIQTADKEIELLEQKLEAFKTQKKGLMQVLLTGTKRLV